MSETLSAQADTIVALRRGLRDLGYVEGKNIVIELRSAEGGYDRLPSRRSLRAATGARRPAPLMRKV